jgi:hypothetical protein
MVERPTRIFDLMVWLPSERVNVVRSSLELSIWTNQLKDREPIESFVDAEEMARQFVKAAEAEGVTLDEAGEETVLLNEAKEAFDENGDLKV